MIIDFQHHYTPPELRRGDPPPDGEIRSIIGDDGNPSHTPNPLLNDLDAHIAMMDFAGIDAAVLSCPPAMDADIETCRIANDAIHAAERKYPGRFIGQAHLPAMGGRDALYEMGRCAEELGFVGVVITSEPRRQPLDAEALNPFWQEACRRNMYVFVHPPLFSLTYDQLNAFDMQRELGREFSLVTATVRLIDGGVLDRFPDLRIQMAHLGGGIAALMGRIRGFHDRAFFGVAGDPRHGRLPEQEFDTYLRHRIVFDTAGVCGEIRAVDAALLELPPSQIVLGTDYPQEIRDPMKIRNFIDAIGDLGRPGTTILSENAVRLLPEHPAAT